MKAILAYIDSISDWTGKAASWLCTALVAVITYDVVARYVFNKATIWGHETSIMLGIVFYIWAWAYVHKEGTHIRVDIIYQRLSLRVKAAIDAVGALLFLPMLIVLVNQSFIWAWRAWVVKERLAASIWFPPAAPVRTIVALGFCLFAFQVVAQLLRDLHSFIRRSAND